MEFFNLLTSSLLLQTVPLLSKHRERLYPPLVALSMFIQQVLDADGSCQNAVNGWAAQRVADGLAPGSTATDGYCRARQRLPTELVSALTRQAGRILGQNTHAHWHWFGHTAKLVDSTVLSMPDTVHNQAVYPQPASQAPGVGFPNMRACAMIDLVTGALLDMAFGPYQGKGSGELSLMRQLLEGFEPSDVMLADALYCTCFLIAALMAKGVDALFAQNGSRNTDFRRGKILGKCDHIVRGAKPAAMDDARAVCRCAR